MFIPRIQIFSIPYLGSKFFSSRIPDPWLALKNLSIILTQKNSRKYDPGCSSRIRITDPDPDIYPYRIPSPGVKKAPNLGSKIRNTDAVFAFLP